MSPANPYLGQLTLWSYSMVAWKETRRPRAPRRTAPATKTAFDTARIPVPCEKCGAHDTQRLTELVANHKTLCGRCKAVIDLTTEKWRARFAEQAAIFKKLAGTG
jgi:hypothetical protein